MVTTWDRWKDKLTPQAFRVFAGASYNWFSPYAKELGAKAGRFVGALLALAADKDEFVRENAAALVVYTLAEDDGKAAPVTPLERIVLMGCLARSAQDADYGVRLSTVMALKSAGGPWATPVLEQMQEREAPSTTSIIREQSKLAIQAIRSRAGQAAPK